MIDDPVPAVENDSMIISKTPLRLTLGGGGTDLPCYYSKFGGLVISTALDRHVYLVVKRRFDREVRVSYSTTEIVKDVAGIRHPLVREVLKLLGLSEHLEIVSIGDVPSKTGLGSSGSFTAGLLNALHAYRGDNHSKQELAEEACHIEMEVLKEPSGKQDPYIACFGGNICLNIDTSGKVTVERLKMSAETSSDLENNLVFFYTGFRRDASEVLKSQKSAIEKDGEKALEAMHRIKEIGFQVKRALERGEITEYGRLQNEHWMAKRSVSTKMSNPFIDKWYRLALENGAIGGKLMGAGGGGFLMFYCENGRDKVRKVMAAEGLREVRFRLGVEGSKIIVNV